MQVKKEQLIRQQEILNALGFYHGLIDGVWGPKSIEAKKKFEASPSFSPGIPKNGMPFADYGPYPANIVIDHATNLLDHPTVAAKRAQPKAPAPVSIPTEAPSAAPVPSPVVENKNPQQNGQQNQQRK